jgi:hypothetical protein
MDGILEGHQSLSARDDYDNDVEEINTNATRGISTVATKFTTNQTP